MVFQNTILAGVVGIVSAVIGLVIVNSVIEGETFSNTTLNTVMQNIPILMGVGLLGFAGAWLFLR